MFDKLSDNMCNLKQVVEHLAGGCIASVSVFQSVSPVFLYIETFIFDFSGDLYDATLSVGLVDYLRPEEKFDNLEALVAQMNDDCARAGAILNRL